MLLDNITHKPVTLSDKMKFCQNLPPNLPTTMSKLAVGTDPASCLRNTWTFLHEEDKVAGLGVLPPGMEVTSVLPVRHGMAHI